MRKRLAEDDAEGQVNRKRLAEDDTEGQVNRKRLDEDDAEGQIHRKRLDEDDAEGQIHRKRLAEDDDRGPDPPQAPGRGRRPRARSTASAWPRTTSKATRARSSPRSPVGFATGRLLGGGLGASAHA